MNIQGNASIKQLTNIEGNSNTVSGNQTLTETIQDVLEQQEPQTRAILQEKISDLEIALKEKEPTKVQMLLQSIKQIAPDVAKIVATTFVNPISGLGLLIDQFI